MTPERRLHDKVAVVTGAGSPVVDGVVGVGRAIATTFARQGAKVVLADRDAAAVAETEEAIRAEEGSAVTVQGDVSNAADCEAIIATALDHYGQLNVLVNNVGVAEGLGRLDSFDDATWGKVIDTNLKSVILMAKAAVGPMASAGGGSIVNIASVAALGISGAGVAYGPSKAALLSVSGELALMYGADGIRSNAIAPGYIYTPMVIGGVEDRRRAERQRASPLNLEGTAWDVAHAAVYLASDEARYITGVCLPVDGGASGLLGLTAASLINE